MITKDIIEREFVDLEKYSELNYANNGTTPTYIKIIRKHNVSHFEYLTLSLNTNDDRFLIRKGCYYYCNINKQPTIVYEGIIPNEYFFDTLIENLSNDYE